MDCHKTEPLWLLKLALLVTFFGDYCSLIGLMEYAKHFGGNAEVVSIFVAYCIPPLVMALCTNTWSRHQRFPLIQAAIFCLLGALSISSLHWTISYLHILLVTLLVGLTKEAVMLLVNVHVKFTYPENQQKQAVNDIVTIRFFIMVFGGALGGYLGEIYRFDMVFLTDAVTYTIAGAIFLTFRAKYTSIPEAGNIRGRSTTGPQRLTERFGVLPLWSMLCGGLGIGSFMALEYPLLTTEMGILPRYMGIIYFWHVLGALCARKMAGRLLNTSSLAMRICWASLGLLITFGVVGIAGNHLLIIGFQIGLIAFFMVITEVISSCHLMLQSNHNNYPRLNLQFRILNRLAVFGGSFVPLCFDGKMTLLVTNIAWSAVLIACSGTLLLLGRFRQQELNESCYEI